MKDKIMSNEEKNNIEEEVVDIETLEEEDSSATEDTSNDESENSEDVEEVEAEEIDPIALAEQKVKDVNDKYLRLMAEFDNYKKRTANEYGKMIQTANKNMMEDLIVVRESFARALETDNENHDAEAFLEGMKLIFKNFDENLSKHGLETFGEVGEKFDPALHDAMMKQASDDVNEDHILQIFEKGYKLKDSIIRHAKVIVSSGK
jgi:molecular chaperone GrpE